MADTQGNPTEFDRALRGTLIGLWAERMARAFWPCVTLGLLFGAALAFGVQDVMPAAWSSALGLGGLAAILVSMIWGAWRLDVPHRADAARRLDQTLPGRPLTAMADQVAVGVDDPGTQALWSAHLARVSRILAQARAVPGDLRLSRFDRFGLRYMAATAAAVAVLFAAPSRVTELGGMAQLPGRAEAIALGPSWEAWVQPPDYTGRPSLYLNEVDRPTLQLPQGSLVTIRFYGQPGIMSVDESLSDRTEADPAAMAQDFTVESSGRLSVRGPAGRDWEITALTDAAPRVTLAGAPVRERGGLMRQDYTAEDDYAVTGGQITVALDLDAVDRRFGLATNPDPRDPLQIVLPLPASGARDSIEDAFIEDFSQHPWANLPVVLRMGVEDARGQTGQSADAHVVLPGRRFFDPMAAAVIELRRDLLWARANGARSLQLMRAISHRPDSAFRSQQARSRFMDTRDLLQASLSDGGLDAATRDDLAQTLWDLAILLEEGELADARARLERAQERLDEAIRNGADPSEIQELMDEMREAMRDYMQQLAEQPRERGEPQQGEGERREVTQDQIQQLMDRIQELMEEGRMEEAAELMAQLNALLENLQVAEGQGGDGPPTPGGEAMEGLGETLRGQQELADDTFGELQEEFREGGQGQGNQPPGPPQQGDGQDGQEQQGQGQQGEGDPQERGGASANDLAERQRDLAEALRQQQLQPLPGEGMPEGDAALDALERAQRAMEGAAEALEEGDSGEALSRQADAMEAMREGLRAMNEAQSQDQREQAEGDAASETGNGDGRDPLGRARNQGGEVGTEQDMLTENDAYERARDLLEELRRRSAELDRPEAELDYLRRLLDRF
ncbi:hypothetical protein ROE7235_00252 [Roseibaca ekhonensis]|uniref:TIGR02302 family protein n=1 Tax=Roseinatronobacter ekhonensis TaxID=254356 RepID=A0A3B0MLK0_9RHOB|nr:DUF4175 family protein [Roseibaca ekhonensis]SUZ30529.1 hypothetical protein ROE7235_00252 [Roseibaca ekhonensis]